MPSSLINQFSLLQSKHTLTAKINSKANKEKKKIPNLTRISQTKAFLS